MSDTRFARLKTDPRFRRPKKHHSKVVLDERFKDLLGTENKGTTKKGAKKATAKVDKYGRTVSATQEKDDLRRFYRLEEEDGGKDVPAIVDYARGAVLMESSDEDEDEDEEDKDLPPHAPSLDESASDSGDDGFISLGAESKKPQDDDDDAEIDLDEDTIATLDAQVAEYAETFPEREGGAAMKQTRRLAVVNLDWDHVRAVHLYKIFSSLLSPAAPLSSISKNTMSANKGGVNVARGAIRSVHVYPSEFGKKRMAREEKEGPPSELFKKKKSKKVNDEEINEKSLFEIGNEADYDEDALRKYQLERLRYYYAIVECDTVDAAAHVYNELEGTELERSANVFDLSFVSDDMTFDDEPRDEATQLPDVPYRAVEFVTDALRHSKVKLTWDEDDPERNHILRRPLTKKEIDEADFRAYVASSSSESDSEEEGGDKEESRKASAHGTKDNSKSAKKNERDRLRSLLLGGNDDDLPEGWGDTFDNKTNRGRKGKTGGEDDDIDMEVTFMPGLSEMKNPEDENTLEIYQRKKKEKRKKKKEEAKEKAEVDGDEVPTKKSTKSSFDDEFFGMESDGQEEGEDVAPSSRSRKRSTQPKRSPETSTAELALLATSDSLHGEPAHFDMKAVLKAEKQAKKSKSKAKKRSKDDMDDGPADTQDDFVIDVKDDRFAAIHDNHQFAIDPTHPQFKKTKSMAALLDERSKRQRSKPHTDHPSQRKNPAEQSGRSLQSLVESVKRKSATVNDSSLGKRRKPGTS